jgi:LmbE family N-acetylglucosaminyl deacetylase
MRRAVREQPAGDGAPDVDLPELDLPDFDPDKPMDDGNPLGTPEAEISWEVDVTSVLPQRRAAVEAHVSQKTDTAWIREMPDELFAVVFGREFYIEPGREAPMRLGWPFAAQPG